MPKFETVRTVDHHADHMFDLVADIQSYPDFIPYCENTRLLEERLEPEARVLLVDMTIGYRFLRETFRSRVTLDRSSRDIRADYISGPVKTLVNEWTFEPLGGTGCRIHFYLDYEFKSRAFGVLMNALFDQVFRRFADAFEARADAVYGRDGRGRTAAS